MINAEERRQLDELQTQVHCDKHFACINDALDNLCEGKYHPELNIMECLAKTDPTCHFARPFGCTLVCTCPLRKFIAKNFDQWTDDTTSFLRPTPPSANS